MSRKRKLTPEEFAAFGKAIYPDFTELAMSLFDEGKWVRDATAKLTSNAKKLEAAEKATKAWLVWDIARIYDHPGADKDCTDQSAILEFESLILDRDKLTREVLGEETVDSLYQNARIIQGKE